jgi:23S rRNA pseudouridine955/2504/2580 synthase
MAPLPVVYEDEDIIVIDKPSGLAVQGGERVSRCVDDLLAEQLGAKAFLVHRLDKDTSGLLLVAKTREAASRWSPLVAGGSVRKTYLAVCSGTPSPASGSIDDPVEKGGRSQEALTRYRTLASRGDFSLLELDLGTGRMHQIRIHLAGVGCPILGDDKYGDFPLNKRLKKERGLKRLLLHAWRLTVRGRAGSRGGAGLSFVAPPPEHFGPFLAELDPDGTVFPA